MSEKLVISLAALFTIAAFAVLPAASQAACTPPACPHVYENGVRTGEGKKVRGIAWGTLKLKNATLGTVECHDIFAGYAENPTGGGAAIGQVQAFFPYECVSSTCISLGGKGITVTAGKLPWRAEVIEPEAGVFRQRTGFKNSTEKNKPPKEAEYVEFKVNCEGVTAPTFFGESNPKILNNGLSIGAAPGEMEFTPGAAGESELESEALGAGEPEGKLKGEGYGTEALAEVHNP
jgi:hypothetical protein